MADDWRLRDERGNVRSLSTQELRDGLAAGSIASSAQVARPGAEFKPAFSVPELATAAIRAKRTPSIPPVGALRPAPGQKAPGGPRPAARAAEVPPAPRSRRRIQNTLVGIHGDEEGVPASEGAPIVAPGAGGAAGNAPRAITQVPRYTPAPSSATSGGTAEVVIPRAPKAPTTLTATDAGWDEAETVQGHSLFDDEDQTLVKRGADGRGPRSQPPPLPPRQKPGDERVPRTTVMGLGAQGLAPRASAQSSPRLVPPKQASTPPPPAVGPASRPPPVPKRAPTPPPTRTPAPPAASRTPAAPPAKPPAKPPTRTPAPAVAAEAGAAPSVASGAPPVEAPPAEAPPASQTPAPPAAEGGGAGAPRESATDVDEAPTSKMAVQIVHGAALAMRAALAAPHPDRSSSDGAATAPPGGGGTPAPPVVTPLPGDATVAELPPVEESGAPAREVAGGDAGAVAPAAALPLPPTSARPSTISSSPPASISAPPGWDEEEGPQSGVEVPVSSLFAASAVWIAGLVLVFFVGRCSALDARASVARRGVAATARLAALAVAPPSQATASEPKPCWVTRQPARWAQQASKNVPFEMVPVPGGSAMLVGYAASDETAVGAKIDLKTGKLTRALEKKVDGGVGRMTPFVDAAGTPSFLATSAEGARVLAAPGTNPPVFVRFGKSGLEVLPSADAAEGTRVHSLEGDADLDATMLTEAGKEGVFASFRRGDAAFGAWIGGDGKARGAVTKMAGSGGTVGKPRAGWNGRQIAVVFADRPEGGRWQVRLGRAGAGEVPATTEVFEIPQGGPGGDAIAPDLVGLADGRWLVMWTEGAAGSRAIRSITLGPDLAPIGDPIALSPPAGNFGQAQLGVAGSYVSVLFLQKGDEDFELWGAVLQCG